jgi:hypothetical protein
MGSSNKLIINGIINANIPALLFPTPPKIA